ncbi:MAG: hypothetical protein H6822_31025 [Planctomycetaceae bacterium]|nr:hypothetical protein [Planctomycetales bacterium]MCB9926615.1 hypothetical protein [Planctomycetaceae bacterium]
MKRMAFAFTILAVAGIAVCAAIAQPPGGGRGPGGQGGGRGPGGPDGFRPPPHPLEEALDADGDHQISAKEIENAVAALKSLDKNEDGKLSEDELRPRFAGRPGGFGGEGRPEGRGPNPDGAPRDRGGQQPGNNDDMLSRVFSFDKNEDGKISKDELPERMHGMIRNGDTNGDEALDRDELRAIAARFRGGDGGRGPDGGRPEGRGPEGGPEGRGPGGPPSPEMLVDMAMRFDADGDEKLSRDELAKFASEMAARRAGQGNQPGRGGRGPEGGDRPEGRPQRPSDN